ncbi:MAG: type II toxin-antitoxin system VapC family toxin [Alphaproteobacteria bacterium]
MIILDTNVVSGLMKERTDDRLVGWMDQQDRQSVWITAITVYETRLGLLRLATGRRRSLLEEQFRLFLSTDLRGQILPFDRDAAEAAAHLDALRRAAGRNVEIRDTQIAGIAIARGASLATRNVRDFADLSVPVIDPWTA